MVRKITGIVTVAALMVQPVVSVMIVFVMIFGTYPTPDVIPIILSGMF